MAHRSDVLPKLDDVPRRSLHSRLTHIFPTAGLERATSLALYTIDADLTEDKVELAATCLTNSLIEDYSLGALRAPSDCAYAIEIGYLPGVTDNVGRTARQTIEDATGKPLAGEADVYSSQLYFLYGSISEAEVAAFAKELHNPLIERANVFPGGAEIPIVVPRVMLAEAIRVDDVNLDVSDEELLRISKAGIQGRGPLALSLKSMQMIRDHFKKLGRTPTDIELESLAGTWSEHCKHTIFADPLDEIEEGIYRRYIKGATEKIRKAKGANDFCMSVFKDNSGAIAFDDEWLVTHKVETHNSPSGLDPFGGSVTAIVGVNRDALGFGLGAKPIANTYAFCVADPNDTSEIFRDKEKTQPLLPARRILEGVVRGINAGGNESGIPTPLGLIAVDPSYRGKPLVYGGTAGLIPRTVGKRKSYEKKAEPGDFIVMIGGRVGLDGVHGATFSSEALSKGSPATAVQIGDPITQKKFSDAIIREARDANLYSSITDNGAGGLSGSVGEMARESGGCDVDLENVPLKYPGLSPWQIWLSESQERMTLAVPKEKWHEFKKIMDRYDVEATCIGTFTDSGTCIVRYKGRTVMDLSLDFLHEGRPIEEQKTKRPAALGPAAPRTDHPSDLRESILRVIGRPSVGSIGFISRQYDHEVQGSSVTKPLQGKGQVNAGAAVLQPVPNSSRGVVLSHGIAPWYSEFDTYAMAAAAIDTAVRNAVCAGARRDYLAILDNFCWSSSGSHERLWQLKEAARACYDIAISYGTPFISGKDSMHNDFRGFDAGGKEIHIAAIPTLLISAIGVIDDVAVAQTVDFKTAGDSLYLLGETHNELGGSEYYTMLGEQAGTAPVVDVEKNMRVYDVVTKALQKGIVVSLIGCERGGLAAALAKSTIAGNLGA